MDTIKRIGRYRIPIDLFTDVTAELRVAVAPEGQELPSEEELAAVEAAEQAELEAAAAQDAEVSEEIELEETPAMHAEERPEDEFDRAVDAAVESEGEEL
jgi:hypothetical protein